MARQNTPQAAPSGAAVGITVFASIVLMVGGFFQVMVGLVALVNDTFYVIGQEYVFALDVTTWGWIHIVVGAVLLAAGFGLFSGAVWARTVGVIVAVLSIIANFLWIPYSPIWSLIIIAIGFFVIWALTVHGRDIAQPLP